MTDPITWRKARGCAANGTCVEVAWRTATASGGGNCVQVGGTSGAVLVRDFTDPDGPRLEFSRAAFGGLLDAIKEGT